MSNHEAAVSELADLRRRLAEAEASAERYRSYFQNANDAIFVSSPQSGKYVAVNTMAADLLGYSEAELLCMGPGEIAAELQTVSAKEIVDRLKKSGSACFRYIATRKDGKNVALDARSVLFEQAGEPCVLTSARPCNRHDICELLHTLLENIPSFVYFKDLERRFVLTSRSFEKMLDVGPGGAIGKRDEDLFPPEIASAAVADDEQILATGTGVIGRVEGGEVIKGQEVWVSTTKLPWYDVNGTIRGLYGISTDISDVKVGQKLLAGSERLRQQVLDVLFDFTGLCTLDGVLVESNRAPLEAAGLVLADVLGKPLEDTYWWNYGTTQRAQLRNALARASDGETVRFETRARVAEGEFIDLDVSFGPLRSIDGDVESVIYFGVDISARTRLLTDLRERTWLLDKAQGLAKVGHWRLDAKTQGVVGSAQLFEIFGIGEDENNLTAFVEAVHPEDAEFNLFHIQRGLTEGEPWDIEHRVLGRDGSIKHVRAAGEPSFADDGTVTHLFGIVVDITQQHQAAEALREQAKIQETLVQEINHRVRNNLAIMLAIIGSERGRIAKINDGTAHAALSGVEGHVRGMSVAHDLLTAHYWQPIPIADLAKAVVESTIQSGLGAVEVAVGASSVRIPVEQVQHFAIILAELTTNSLKYGRDSAGQLRIEVSFPADSTIRFRDHGPGFPEAITRGEREPDQLGLGLLEGLASHSLGSTVKFSTDGGAVVTLQLPNDELLASVRAPAAVGGEV